MNGRREGGTARVPTAAPRELDRALVRLAVGPLYEELGCHASHRGAAVGGRWSRGDSVYKHDVWMTTGAGAPHNREGPQAH
jgi:hypothetical protein